MARSAAMATRSRSIDDAMSPYGHLIRPMCPIASAYSQARRDEDSRLLTRGCSRASSRKQAESRGCTCAAAGKASHFRCFHATLLDLPASRSSITRLWRCRVNRSSSGSRLAACRVCMDGCMRAIARASRLGLHVHVAITRYPELPRRMRTAERSAVRHPGGRPSPRWKDGAAPVSVRIPQEKTLRDAR